MNYVYFGLGSNIGERERNLLQAVSLLHENCDLLRYSSIYLTSPVGFKNQPDFLNMVVEVNSGEKSPVELLRLAKSIEKMIGRRKTVRWGPRIIDIDILYMQDVIVATEELTIPHKELFHRLFFLVPLSELIDSLIIDGEKVYLKTKIEKLSTGKSIEDHSERGVSLYKRRESIRVL